MRQDVRRDEKLHFASVVTESLKNADLAFKSLHANIFEIQ